MGGTGNDTLVGDTGQDLLIGVDSSIGLGLGEIDLLNGGEETLTALCWVIVRCSTTMANAADQGLGDYAQIVGLESNDLIQLAGSLNDYLLVSGTTVDGQTGTGIFWLGDGSATGEFIALVQDTEVSDTQATFDFV